MTPAGVAVLASLERRIGDWSLKWREIQYDTSCPVRDQSDKTWQAITTVATTPA